jgi:arylsulfatase A-like enzyme
MVFALREQGLLNNTAIVLTAKHGEAPVGNVRTVVSTGIIASILNAAVPPIPTKKITLKTSALIWLTNQSQTTAAVAALNASSTLAANLSPGGVLSFGFGLPFPDPLSDAAPPDIVVVMKDGVNFEPLGSQVFAEHGGFGENETHVPLMVSNPKWTGLPQTSTVSTRQIAPTVLSLLGLNPQDLLAVQMEGTQPLSDVLVQ